MTREEVIVAARKFMLHQNRSVLLEPISVRHLDAARFNRILGRREYPTAFWVVEFKKVLLQGVAVEMPSSVLVEVFPNTGEVREVYPGMHVN